jgi:hypothetical protein
MSANEARSSCFFVAERSGFSPDDAEGTEFLTVRCHEGRTGVGPDIRLAEDVGIRVELFVLGGVGDDHHAVLSDGDGTERLAEGDLRYLKAMIGLEPLPVLVHKGDQRHGHVEDACGQLYQVIELGFRGRVEDAVAAQGGQPALFGTDRIVICRVDGTRTFDERHAARPDVFMRHPN